MKILYFSAYFYPERYSSELIYLNLLKHFTIKNEVNVITPRPTREIAKKDYNEYKKSEIVDNIKIFRFNAIKERKFFILKSIRYYLCNKKYKKYINLLKTSDIYFCASTPPNLALVVGKLAKKYNKPFIYNLQDVFPDSLLSTKILKHQRGFIWNYGRKLENKAYNFADNIVVVSNDIKRNIVSKGVDEKKISLIYNSIQVNNYKKIEKEDNCLYKEFDLDKGKKYITYAGNLGKAQNIDIILEAANHLKYLKDLVFVIIGNGIKYEEIKNKILIKNIKNVYLFPLQPISKINEVYNLGIASIVTCNKEAGGSAMPSKTWTILSTETPVLASYDDNSELKNMIEVQRVGLYSKSNDINSFIENIKIIYNNENLAKEMGLNGRRYVEENISNVISFKKYDELFNNVLANYKNKEIK